MNRNAYPKPALSLKTPSPHHAIWRSSVSTEAAIEFGRFRVLLRRRQLFAAGVPVELGTRAFDLLLVLLEADGALVTKEELLNRVWPGIVVSEENLKVQISALRKTLGAFSSARISAAATGSLAYCARTRPRTPLEAPGEQSCGFLELLRQNGRQSLQCGFYSSW